MTSAVRISAPSRLHFGLLRFAQESHLSYGGLGMMIEQPRFVVELSLAEHWSVSSLFGEKALKLARRSLQACSPAADHALKVEVISAPAPHSGLGSGTQLALSIATGVRELCQVSPLEIDQLVAGVSRGQRSAVGSHGFQLGGLIWEQGRKPGEALGQLKHRVEMPTEWRIVLIALPHDRGLSGRGEQLAFDQLPPVPVEVTDQLILWAEEQILPAAEQRDFESFCEALFQYGRLAGSCFELVQGGPFASSRIAASIEKLRELGVRGVGQSSWGPTVFAFAADLASAGSLVERIGGMEEFTGAQFTISLPDNRGAWLETISSPAIAGHSNP